MSGEAVGGGKPCRCRRQGMGYLLIAIVERNQSLPCFLGISPLWHGELLNFEVMLLPSISD